MKVDRMRKRHMRVSLLIAQSIARTDPYCARKVRMPSNDARGSFLFGSSLSYILKLHVSFYCRDDGLIKQGGNL